MQQLLQPLLNCHILSHTNEDALPWYLEKAIVSFQHPLIQLNVIHTSKGKNEFISGRLKGFLEGAQSGAPFCTFLDSDDFATEEAAEIIITELMSQVNSNNHVGLFSAEYTVSKLSLSSSLDAVISPVIDIPSRELATLAHHFNIYPSGWLVNILTSTLINSVHIDSAMLNLYTQNFPITRYSPLPLYNWRLYSRNQLHLCTP